MADSQELEFMADDRRSGYRLDRLEVYNWGTFDSRVTILHLNGQNALLTGDIGSGKSTLVDAVTTLVIPSQKIAYNKAAGAEKKERDLRSYVLGYYKSERQEHLGNSKPVALRDHNNYSVILGVFSNEGYSKTITLAQVFHSAENHAQPKRFYITAERDLSIAGEFSNFKDINSLRKKLREAGVNQFDTFPPYGAWFRRRFGNIGEQALELLHQTVSLKSIGNLTDFVRNHMLEPFDVAPRIKALIHHFDDLQSAHTAVCDARKQMEELTPIVTKFGEHKRLSENMEQRTGCRNALTPWFSKHKMGFIRTRISELEEEIEGHLSNIQALEARKNTLIEKKDEYRLQISKNGGDQLEKIKEKIPRLTVDRDQRLEASKRYSELADLVGLSPADNEQMFASQRRKLQSLRDTLDEREADTTNRLSDLDFNIKTLRRKLEGITSEIDSLKQRRSNISEAQVGLRAKICRSLNIPEAKLPFAGELLRVCEAESTWEGAIERILHNFGLSLLVPDDLYKKVSTWVDQNNLKGRLVYYRVPKSEQKKPAFIHPSSLIRKVEIKQDSSFSAWIERELNNRFDIACCETMEQFQKEQRAVSLKGQIKGTHNRHEKDDRHDLNDRRRYVLGWSNEAKIAVFTTQAKRVRDDITSDAQLYSEKQSEQRSLRSESENIAKLDEIRSFSTLDWQSVAKEIANLEDERDSLESSTDILKELSFQLDNAISELEDVENDLKVQNRSHSKKEQKKEDASLKYKEAEVEYTHCRPEQSRYFEALNQLRNNPEHCWIELSASTYDRCKREMSSWLNTHIEDGGRTVNELGQKLIKLMADYKNEWPLETQEVDASLAAETDFIKMLEKLQADDLPRFEQKFKDLLNENTIREVASFNAQLHRERSEIKDRIKKINKSLTRIDYNKGRYIRLEDQSAGDREINDFIQELRCCTEGSLTGTEDQQYSEAKFLQVQHIIERFKGREGYVDIDRRWTEKVTDVRKGFVFAASERCREDDIEYEHYADSGGKSGGQKEKLAYTVLAASLAYQFGLEFDEPRSNSFRFVAIDEAFGRGSDESTQYGLDLFKQLNLQLLIITPLQKIHIIDPYVFSVGFVFNPNGQESYLRNLSIEDYRKEKKKREQL